MDIEAANRELAPGQGIDAYVIDAVLASTDTSITYKASDPDLKPVVLKELNPVSLVSRNEAGQLIPNSTESEQVFEQRKKQFVSVGTVLSEIDNKSIVKVNGLISANNTSYLLMDFEDGFSLQEVLAQTSALEYEDIKNIIFPLLGALKTLHARNLLHLAISSNNVLIRKDGSPLFIGMRCLYESNASSELAAPPIDDEYAPIEQFSSDKTLLGQCSDIYSLAAVLYRCIAGHTPAKSNERYHAVRQSQADPYQSIKQSAQGKFAVSMLEAVDHALALKPGDRPKSVDEWSQEFLTLSDKGDLTVVKEKEKMAAAPEKAAAQSEFNGLTDERHKLFRALLGGSKQSYYMSVLIQQDRRGFVPRLKWNFAAFVFNIVWVFYRKMYLFAVLLLTFVFAPALFGFYMLAVDYLSSEKFYFISPTVDYTAAAYFIFKALFLGFFGNYIYYLHIRRKISQSRNKFPDIKRQRSWLSKKGGTSLAVAIFMGIFLIADTYSNYKKLAFYKDLARVEMNEAVALLNEAAQKVAMFRQRENRWPTNIRELANPPDVRRYQYISRLETVKQMIVVTFKERMGVRFLAGRSMAYIGYESNGKIQWTCGTIDAPFEYLPPVCKKKLQ